MKSKVSKPRSEFPDTILSRIFNKIGWVLSPVLLIFLIIFTLYSAEGVEDINFREFDIVRRGGVEFKDIENAQIYVNGEASGKTPRLVSLKAGDTVNLSLKKDNRIEWIKKYVPQEALVKIYYPILYPQNPDFDANVEEVIMASGRNFSSFTFYLQKIDSSYLLTKYEVQNQLLSPQISEERFADISSLITEEKNIPVFFDFLQPEETGTNKIPTILPFKLIPGNDGKEVLLIVEGKAIYILRKDKDPEIVPSFKLDENSEYYWSAKDSHIVIKSGNELYGYELGSKRIFVIHRASPSDNVQVQFTLENAFVYSVSNDTLTNLIQNNYEGVQEKEIAIPNIDNLRSGNFIAAYDMSEEKPFILLQSKDNIYLFNAKTLEMEKQNLFEGERIILSDNKRQMFLTHNASNPTQFRLYDVKNEESKSFTLNTSKYSTPPKEIYSFNGSQNFIFAYSNSVFLLDADGANQVEITGKVDPQIALATRVEDEIQFAIIEDIPPEPNEIEEAEPSSNPTPTPEILSPLTTPAEVILTNGTVTTPSLELTKPNPEPSPKVKKLSFLIFKN